MKKRKLILTLLIICILSLFMVACSDNREEQIKNKFPIKVNFYGNGAMFSEETDIKYFLYKENSYILEVDYPNRQGYDPEGWFVTETNSEGENIIENDEIKLTNKQWDFKNDTVTESLNLAIKWKRNLNLTVLDLQGNLEEIAEYPFKLSNGVYSVKEPSSSKLPKKDGWSFTTFYYDENRTQKVVFPVNTEEGQNKTIYADFVEGDYAVCKSAKELSLALASNKNVYLLEDIDYSEDKFTPVNYYSGIIKGNNKKIKNINIVAEITKANRVDSYGLFKNLDDSSIIQDIIFENVSIKYSFPEKYQYSASLGFISGNIGNATIKGITAETNCSINILNKANATLAKFGIVGSSDETKLIDCVNGIVINEVT